MEYPISIGNRHNNTGKRRSHDDTKSYLTLYGYDSEMNFVSERIGRISAVFKRRELFKEFEVECGSCLGISKIIAKRPPKRWKCASCRQSEPEIDFNYQLEA